MTEYLGMDCAVFYSQDIRKTARKVKKKKVVCKLICLMLTFSVEALPMRINLSAIIETFRAIFACCHDQMGLKGINV